MTETVELSAGSARAVIAPAIGGSIAAFQFDGQAILRPTPEKALAEGVVRDFACFPLIPFSNRIADATLHWAGREYGLTRYVDAEPHAIHGNGWQRRWSVTRREASRLAIELEHDATGVRAREWPFPYRARQRFALVADALAATEDTQITYTKAQLLGNDTDVDNSNAQLSINSVTSAPHTELTVPIRAARSCSRTCPSRCLRAATRGSSAPTASGRAPC